MINIRILVLDDTSRTKNNKNDYFRYFGVERPSIRYKK